MSVGFSKEHWALVGYVYSDTLTSLHLLISFPTIWYNSYGTCISLWWVITFSKLSRAILGKHQLPRSFPVFWITYHGKVFSWAIFFIILPYSSLLFHLLIPAVSEYNPQVYTWILLIEVNRLCNSFNILSLSSLHKPSTFLFVVMLWLDPHLVLRRGTQADLQGKGIGTVFKQREAGKDHPLTASNFPRNSAGWCGVSRFLSTLTLITLS